MAKLEPHYDLFDSLDHMLAPETLSKLHSQPVTRVHCRPMNGHAGLAGGQLSHVDTDAGRFILKQMSLESDYIMLSSNDRLCRSVTLWQYGLLDQLRPHLEHKILACSREGDGWAILMDDLTGYFFAWDKPMAPELVPVFLDTMARFHAVFWNDPQLKSPSLGLCSPAQLLDMTTLPMKQKELSMGVIPDWIRGGWEVMEELLDSDVFAQMRDLVENPQPVFDALSKYPYTLLHGDYRAENLAHLHYPIVIDWQEAACSLMTIDLAWFVKHGYVRDGMGQVQAVNYYRQRLEAYLHQRFDDIDWQAMVELGYLVDALRITCVSAYWYKQNVDNPSARDYLRADVKIRNQQVRDAMRWLEK